MNHNLNFTLKKREMLKHFFNLGRNQVENSTLYGKINHLSQEKLDERVKMENTSLVKLILSIKKSH